MYSWHNRKQNIKCYILADFIKLSPHPQDCGGEDGGREGEEKKDFAPHAAVTVNATITYIKEEAPTLIYSLS